VLKPFSCCWSRSSRRSFSGRVGGRANTDETRSPICWLGFETAVEQDALSQCRALQKKPARSARQRLQRGVVRGRRAVQTSRLGASNVAKVGYVHTGARRCRGRGGKAPAVAGRPFVHPDFRPEESKFLPRFGPARETLGPPIPDSAVRDGQAWSRFCGVLRNAGPRARNRFIRPFPTAPGLGRRSAICRRTAREFRMCFHVPG